MPTLDYYMQHADELAKRVIEAWELGKQSSNPTFEELFDKASQYTVAKRVAEERQGQPDLEGPDQTEEQATLLAFAEAYKAFDESQASGPLTAGS